MLQRYTKMTYGINIKRMTCEENWKATCNSVCHMAGNGLNSMQSLFFDTIFEHMDVVSVMINRSGISFCVINALMLVHLTLTGDWPIVEPTDTVSFTIIVGHVSFSMVVLVQLTFSLM